MLTRRQNVFPNPWSILRRIMKATFVAWLTYVQYPYLSDLAYPRNTLPHALSSVYCDRETLPVLWWNHIYNGSSPQEKQQTTEVPSSLYLPSSSYTGVFPMYIPTLSKSVMGHGSSPFCPLTSWTSWLWWPCAFHALRYPYTRDQHDVTLPYEHSQNDYRVLILGGGVAGLNAAQTLHQEGVDDFMVVEASGKLGGRMKSFVFGSPGREYTLEAGANWIHGTQIEDGPANPIYELAHKHNLSMQLSHYTGSMSKLHRVRLIGRLYSPTLTHGNSDF